MKPALNTLVTHIQCSAVPWWTFALVWHGHVNEISRPQVCLTRRGQEATNEVYLWAV